MKSLTRETAVLTVAMTLLPCLRLLSFPIEPVPLLDLVMRSDLIVLATVEAPPAKPPGARLDHGDLLVSYFGKSPARLRPLSVLKGTAPTGLVYVDFNANMVCPAPPRFPPGSNVLAFLVRNAGPNDFHTVGLHYGAKLLSPAEIEPYTRQIKALLPIIKAPESVERSRRITEWLVTCV